MEERHKDETCIHNVVVVDHMEEEVAGHNQDEVVYQMLEDVASDHMENQSIVPYLLVRCGRTLIWGYAERQCFWCDT